MLEGLVTWLDGILFSTECLLWISNGSGGGFPNPCGLAVQTTVMFLRAMVPLLSGFSCHYSRQVEVDGVWSAQSAVLQKSLC